MVICELEEVKVEEGNKKQKVCQPQRHFYGLYNQGSTCYLNSVLQVLFMTPELHDRLDPQSQTIDEALRNLFKELEETTCNTERLTRILQITDVYEQCDAAECLEKILNQVSSQASEIFQGVLRNTTKCFEEHDIIEDTDPFWTLPVSLKDSSDSVLSVKDAFEMIFQPAAYSEGNLVHCSECCMKTEAISVCKMEKSPQILILLLKRFDFNYYLMSYVKSDRRVEVPCTLQTKEKKYELYGMIHHMGSLRYGHYTATILSPEDNAWYKFNDSYVNKVEEHLFEQTDTYISSTAYLLIYRASGCPGVKVTHDAQNEEELESEKEADAEHSKEEPTNNELEASPLIPQQNPSYPSDLQEMNSCGIKEEASGCPGNDHQDEEELGAEQEVDAEHGTEECSFSMDVTEASLPIPHQNQSDPSDLQEMKPCDTKEEASSCQEDEVTHNHRDEQELESEKEADTEQKEEEPTFHIMEASPLNPQQNRSDLQEKKSCGMKEEASDCPGDDHWDGEELGAEKEVDAEHGKEEPTNNEMEDSPPNPQLNPSAHPEMNPRRVKEEASGCPGNDHQDEEELGAEQEVDAEHGTEECSFSMDVTEASLPIPQQNQSDPSDLQEMKPCGTKEEASSCPEDEVTHNHRDEQELESEKEADTEQKEEEPTFHIMEASPLNPQQNRSDPSDLQEMKSCGMKEEASGCPGDDHQDGEELGAEKEVDAEHGKEKCSITTDVMGDSPFNPQQNPSDPSDLLLEMKPLCKKEEASGCQEDKVTHDHQDEEKLGSEKEVDTENEKEECSNIIDIMEASPLNPQQNPSDPSDLQEIKSCGIKEEASSCQEDEVRDDHEEELRSEKEVDAENRKEECSVTIDEDPPFNPQQNPSDPSDLLLEMKPLCKKEEDEDSLKSSRSSLRQRCTIPSWVVWLFLSVFVVAAVVVVICVFFL